MKKSIILIVLVLITTGTFSQIETQYYFDSNDSKISNFLLNEDIPIYKMDSFDSQKNNVEEQNSPNKFAKGYDVSILLGNGLWTNVDKGRVWSVAIQSNNSCSLTLHFIEFNLPKEGYMYIVNEDKTIIYGPVMSDNTPNEGIFLTDVIPGKSIRVCIFEPASAYGKTSMKIDKIYCGYKNQPFINNEQQLNLRGCDNEIACDNNFQKESYGVACIVYSLGNHLFYSTGFLVMATDLSFKPYLQTAYHTMDIIGDGYFSDAERIAVQNGTFKFNYKYSSCGGSTLATTDIYNGATIRAYSSTTDFGLLELSSTVSNNSALTWLGWDRSSSVPTSGTAIHHPLGSTMKISYEYDLFSTSDLNGNGIYNYWLVNFDDGVVKHGSSGSPILNQNKRVVGQLCGNDQYDENLSYCVQKRAQYGKFHLSWTGGGHNNDRLSNWLDPIGTNQTTIESSHPIGGIIGDNIICSYEDYYIQNLPNGYTVTWSVSNSNLSIISGQGTGTVTFQRNANGECIIIAQVKMCGTSIKTLSKNVWAGTPTAPSISGWPSTNLFLANSQYQLYANVNSQAQVSEYQWDVVRGATITSGGNTDSPIFTINPSGTVRIGVRAKNACGWGPYTYMNGGITNDNGQTPINSPGNNIVNIPLPGDGEYEVMLWNTNRLIRTVKTSQSSYDVDLNGLPSDLYIIKVMKDGQSIYQLKVKK